LKRACLDGASSITIRGMSEEQDKLSPGNRILGTLLWGVVLGTGGGVVVSIANVLVMFSMGENWGSIHWPMLGVACLMYYIGPLAGLGVAIALPIAVINFLFRR
jgi:hypothetical protein